LFAQAARASRAFGPVTLPHFEAIITESSSVCFPVDSPSLICKYQSDGQTGN